MRMMIFSSSSSFYLPIDIKNSKADEQDGKNSMVFIRLRVAGRALIN